ncbi:hybrid sensor histidine kinase/response regulator [Sabulicella glaciei]|uniref:histidine kinase n=1 Tax=Sabulicella glaciei TaxID=2984948 RepID=A0ABT3NWY2_9PROT|nr:PAS domain-containing protein [Roseococcus sp. MDT2-1-1]MCW8086667.1 PAS domain-containing protein [Roseococcus sp. MDT2-1-1]
MARAAPPFRRRPPLDPIRADAAQPPRRGLRLSLAALALVALLPLALWAWVALEGRSRALASAEAEMGRATAILAEQALRLLESQSTVLELVDQVAGERACPELRFDPSMRAFLRTAAHQAAQTEAAWIINADGTICLGSRAGQLDDLSRAERGYFTGARDAPRGHTHIERAMTSMADGLPFFSLSRRRGEDRFDGIIVITVDLSGLVAYWGRTVAVLPSQRVAMLRADGAFIARSWAPMVPAPDERMEAGLAALWGEAPQGGGLGIVSPVDHNQRIASWRRLPGWDVVVTSSMAAEEALRPWRRFTLLSGLVALGISTLLAAFLWTVARARMRLEEANAALEGRVAQRTAQLRESEARFRAITDAMPQIVWSTRADGFHDFYNRRWYEYTGTTPEQVHGMGWAPVFHPEDQPQAWARWRRSLDTGEPYEVEYRLRATDGSYRWMLGRALPVRDDTGEILRWFGTCTDIQEIVEAREVLARSRAELETLIQGRTRDLQATQARLAQAQRMEALGQLAGGIAHDFNNVLQAVQGGAGLIERRPGEAASVHRLARMVVEAAERGASITRRLLAFARRGDLRAEPVEAAPLLADMAEILRHTLGTGIELRVEAPEGLPPLLADKGQLETVLVNLATNARDAMDGQGRLTLSAATDSPREDGAPGRPVTLRAGSYVRLSVSDTGTGMSPEIVARATEPFFTTKPPGQGTGLGLAIVRGFAEQSGGALGIESASGRGTAVHLWLPLAEAEASGEPPSVAPAEAPRDGVRARLMLVDDDAVVRGVTAEQLAEAGYAVRQAADGPSALALLDAGEAVDLLVSDLSMPGMDGVSLVRAAQRRRPRLPAILLTGFATHAAELALGGALSGTFSLLRKPVTAEQLAERVAVLLEGSGVADAAPPSRKR